MRVVAVLAVHDERPYLANCLSYLVESGIDFAVVDNGSIDGSAELVHGPHFRPHLAGYRYVPFTGVFKWQDILVAQEQLLKTIKADWNVLLAPDEIVHSYVPNETLAAAIARLDRQDCTVIDFDEFVFLPVDGDYVPDSSGIQPLRHYYFFEPDGRRQMRAWKTTAKVSNIQSGGHAVTGANVRLAPESFAMRHYMFRSQAHAFDKYVNRAFADDEVRRGWHRNRVGKVAAQFTFPPAETLCCLAASDDRNLKRDQPRKSHYWEVEMAAAGGG